MLRFACWVLVLLLLPGLGDPYGIITATASGAAPMPAEEDDCVETIKVASTPQRQRHEKIRDVHRVSIGRSAIHRHDKRSLNGDPRSVTTAFLAALNLPILC